MIAWALATRGDYDPDRAGGKREARVRPARTPLLECFEGKNASGAALYLPMFVSKGFMKTGGEGPNKP